MAPQRTSKVSAPLSKDNTKVKKRAPSAYNNFMATHMKTWRTEHPAASAKEAMAAIAAQWKDSPENPNRGKPSKPKKTHNKENADTSTDPSSDAVAGPSSDSY